MYSVIRWHQIWFVINLFFIHQGISGAMGEAGPGGESGDPVKTLDYCDDVGAGW